MAGTLYTYGATITGTAAYFASFDTIAVSPANLTGQVSLVIEGGGTADLSSQLLGRPSQIVSSANTSIISGSNKNDVIYNDYYSGTGVSAFYGNDGDDTLTIFGSVNGSLYGGDGDDHLYAYRYASILDGGDGNDVIRGSEGNDIISGGDGDDFIEGEYKSYSTGDDTIDAGAGNDTIIDYVGNVSIDAGSGDDTITLGRSTKGGVVDGGEGVDTLLLPLSYSTDYLSSLYNLELKNVEVLKIGQSISGRRAQFESFQHIVSIDPAKQASISIDDPGKINLKAQLAGQDAIIYGSSGNDDIVASDGDDTLIGRSGDDILEGGAGADTIDGGRSLDGPGVNTASYAGAASGVTVSLTTKKGTRGDALGDTLIEIQNLRGSAHDDELMGDAKVNRLEGGGGDDVLEGRAGADALVGGEGSDAAAYINAAAGVRVDLGLGTGTGDAAGDTFDSIENLIGSAFADTLIGDGGANVLEGLAGADGLSGGGGSDTASYSRSASGVRGDLAAGKGTGGDAEGDIYASIENLIGSAFADTLIGNAGVNRLEGGGGDDLLSGRGGADILIGGAGVDTTTYNLSAAAVTVNLATGTGSGGDAEGDTLSGIENILGTAYADTLIGDDNDNELTGGVGPDKLFGGGGRDTAAYRNSSAAVTINLASGTVSGGDATGDTISSIENVVGSAYSDTLIGDGGANQFTGGFRGDIISGGGGSDTARYDDSSAAVEISLTNGTASGGDANGDVLTSIENLVGSVFADRLIGNAGVNRLEGGAGDDLISGRGGADALIGGAGIDTTTYNASTAGVNVNLATGTGLGGDAQGDTLSGIENVIGSAYDDTLTADGHANALTGGNGIDTVSLAMSSAAVRVDLTAGIGTGGDAEGDTYATIENIVGSGFNDTLIGTAGANVIEGGEGDDTLAGRQGADRLIGGGGIDTASYGSSTSVRVDLTNNNNTGGEAEGDFLSGIENIKGSPLDDTLIGSAGANIINGGKGDDLLSGRAGADTLNGDGGFDTATYNASSGAVTVNLVTGTGLGGDAEGDELNSIEHLIGSSKNDTLIGNAGANRLAGGLGNDTLTGNAGADSFVFNSEPGTTNTDTLTDFTIGSDVIELSKSIYSALQSGSTPGSLSAASFRYSSNPSTSGGLGEIVYNATTGTLAYDADGAGSGAARQFAKVSTFLALSASDFRLA